MLSLLEMSVTGGILIVAVVIIRALAVHRLPKAGLLVFWAAALCRLLLPFRLPSPTSLYAHAPALELTGTRPGVLLGGTAGAAAQVAQTQAESHLPVALLVWAAVATGLAICFVVAHVRGRRRYRISLPVEDPFVRAWLDDHRLRRPVQVRCSDQIDAPFTYGVLWPVILLPKSLDRSDEERLVFILAHEMAHIRRCDALIKWVLALTLCLHWFNPLVWVMYVLANRDLELCCDESVVRRYGREARASYARTLVGLEEKRAHFAPLCSSFAKNALEERITAIMKHKKATAAGIAGAAVLVAVLVAVFATNAPKPAATPAPAAGANPLGTAASYVDEALSAAGRQNIAQVVEDGLRDYEDQIPAYTQKQYDMVMERLRFDGYRDMSIAEFNRKINAAFHADDDSEQEWEDGLSYAYEMVRMSLDRADPNADFVYNTVQASMEEYQTRLSEVYSGKREDPSFSGSAERYREDDVFGETVRTGYVRCEYEFTYRILDQDKLTVALRDQFLQDVMAGAQAYLDGKTLGELIDDKDAEASFKAALEAAGAAASNDGIEFTGCEVYYYEDY